MAEERPPTPEKQLLKLIEEGKSGEGVTQAKLKRKGLGFLSLSALKGGFSGRFSFLRRSTQKRLSKKKALPDLASVNRVLAVATAAFFLYVVGDATASAINMRTATNFAFQKEKTASFELLKLNSPLRDAGQYLEKVSARDIFRGAEQFDRKVEKRAAPAASAPKKESPLKNMALVGISWRTWYSGRIRGAIVPCPEPPWVFVNREELSHKVMARKMLSDQPREPDELRVTFRECSDQLSSTESRELSCWFRTDLAPL